MQPIITHANFNTHSYLDRRLTGDQDIQTRQDAATVELSARVSQNVNFPCSTPFNFHTIRHTKPRVFNSRDMIVWVDTFWITSLTGFVPPSSPATVGPRARANEFLGW